MLSMALHLRGQDLSLRDIAARLVVTSGAKAADRVDRNPAGVQPFHQAVIGHHDVPLARDDHVLQ
jgi:hypothetical protein